MYAWDGALGIRERCLALPPPSSSPLGGHPAEGNDDAAKTFAQLQGGIGGQFGGVVEAFDLSRAVQ